MPSVSLKNCTNSPIGVIVFNPADVIRAVDAGQYVVQPGESHQLDTTIAGTNFSVGICYDTYYALNDNRFANYWGSVDSHGVRGNWMKYRLFRIDYEDIDTEVCVNDVSYCSAEGEGIIMKHQNGQQLEPVAYSEQHYREVSLGFILCLLAPLMGMKQEGEILIIGAMVLHRVSQIGLTIKDLGLLTCCILRLYHLQQAKGVEGLADAIPQAAHQLGEYIKAKAPELADKAGEKGHKLADKADNKGREVGGKGKEIGSDVAQTGHQAADEVQKRGPEIGEKAGQATKELGQQAGQALEENKHAIKEVAHDIKQGAKEIKQTAKETGQQVSEAIREFLRPLGLDGILDQVTSGGLSTKDIENIVIMLLKLSGASDWNIKMLYHELGMEGSVLFDTWWKGTQGHIEGARKESAPSSGQQQDSGSTMNKLGNVASAAASQLGGDNQQRGQSGQQQDSGSTMNKLGNVAAAAASQFGGDKQQQRGQSGQQQQGGMDNNDKSRPMDVSHSQDNLNKSMGTSSSQQSGSSGMDRQSAFGTFQSGVPTSQESKSHSQGQFGSTSSSHTGGQHDSESKSRPMDQSSYDNLAGASSSGQQHGSNSGTRSQFGGIAGSSQAPHDTNKSQSDTFGSTSQYANKHGMDNNKSQSYSSTTSTTGMNPSNQQQLFGGTGFQTSDSSNQDYKSHQDQTGGKYSSQSGSSGMGQQYGSSTQSSLDSKTYSGVGTSGLSSEEKTGQFTSSSYTSQPFTQHGSESKSEPLRVSGQERLGNLSSSTQQQGTGSALSEQYGGLGQNTESSLDSKTRGVGADNKSNQFSTGDSSSTSQSTTKHSGLESKQHKDVSTRP